MVVEDEFGKLPRDAERLARKWMKMYSVDYSNSTALAEACADELNLYLDDEDYKIPEHVFEIALEYVNEC